MKKLNLVLIILILFSTTTLVSCKKDTNACSTCIVKDDNGNITKNYGEKCGTSTDVDNYEASSKADANQLPGTCTCTRK